MYGRSSHMSGIIKTIQPMKPRKGKPMNISGYSLFELIATLCVTTITLAIGIPSFLDLKQKSQLENTYKLLLDSIQLARTQAVIQNQRTILIHLIELQRCTF